MSAMPFVPIKDLPPPWRFGVSALLAPGAVLLPGNWWRVVQAINAREKTAKAPPKLRHRLEEIFEEQRAKHAADAPSRMSCLFVCPSAADAGRFSDSQPDRTDVWYDVEPTEELQQVFVAGWDIFKIADLNEATTLRARKSALRYWTEAVPEGAKRELLIPCGVRVVKAL